MDTTRVTKKRKVVAWGLMVSIGIMIIAGFANLYFKGEHKSILSTVAGIGMLGTALFTMACFHLDRKIREEKVRRFEMSVQAIVDLNRAARESDREVLYGGGNNNDNGGGTC